MSALSVQVPFPVFQDRDGQPLDNGYVWVGVANLNPQINPVVVYFDAALTIPAPQPLRTLNGYISRAGTPAQIYVDGANFSILVQDSKGSMVYNFPDGSGISPNANGVEYDPPFTGAVTSGYTVQDKLRQTVSADDFIPVGTNKLTTDCGPFIQLALDTGYDVILPSNAYMIGTTLQMRGQRLIGTGTTTNNGSWNMTQLIMSGNISAITFYPGLFSNFEIDGLFIFYGDTVPTTSVGNSAKIGIDFTATSGSPQMVKVSNCIVKGGWYGYFNTSGSYLSILERIWVWNCKFAFCTQ